MTLIKCSECNKEISNKALNCPNCGQLISNVSKAQVTIDPNKPIQIEPILTSKKWKKVKLLSWGIVFLGFIISTTSNNPMWLLLSFLGGIVLIIAIIGAWYADKRTR